MKPRRRRVYLFITRVVDGAGELLVFSHGDPRLWAGVQTPGGTVEPDELPEVAAIREAIEETGLTHYDSPRFLATDEHENPDEWLERWFYQLPCAEPTSAAWTHRVGGAGVDSAIEFDLRWIALPQALGLDDHFRTYLDLVEV